MAARKRRSYNNLLRQQQSEQTRLRILEAVVDLFASSTPGTIADIAKRAGVSEPTIYRHFGGRERLLDELDAYCQARVGIPPMPKSIDAFPEHGRVLFQHFNDNGPLLRAMSQAGLGSEIRTRGKAKRFKLIQQHLAEKTDHLEGREALAVAAMLRVLVGFETWQRYVDELGVDPEVAADGATWVLSALLEKLDRDRARGQRRLRSTQPKERDR